MNYKKKILFGASKLGKKALLYFGKDDVRYFCDNDNEKVGSKVDGINIISFNELLNIYKKYEIVITSMFEKEISEQLKKSDINDYSVYRENIERHYPVNNLKEINLGYFLSQCDFSIKLESLTLFQNSSTILDYVFLQALAKKFDRKKYLEIGSFMGESAKCLSGICEECLSISLKDDELEQFFESKNKKNFSSYFMNDLENVKQTKGDSQKIDFEKLQFKPDLVFIDGDHSYNGVFSDTKNIFNLINSENTIVVWHDFRMAITKEIRTETVRAAFDALPKKYHSRIFVCDNNLCGIYIPEKYINCFSTENFPDEIYSYDFKLCKVTKNSI